MCVFRRLFVVVFATVLFLEVGCSNPTRPSAVDENNRPPSPAEGIIPARIDEIHVYKGDCFADRNQCGQEIFPASDAPKATPSDNYTYWAASHQQVYTIWAKLVHQSWQKRDVSFGASASMGSNLNSFVESTEVSPLWRSARLNLMTPTGVTNTSISTVSLVEGGWDMFDWTPPVDVRITLGFRVVGSK